MAKLLEIERLADGWAGPGSRAVIGSALNAYRGFIARLGSTPDEVEPFPTFVGGIRIEWDRDESSYIAELGPEGTFLCYLAEREEDDYEEQLDEIDIDRLVTFYRESKETRA